ncbi:MAG: hypothetical protein ACFFDT_15495 [Candidatus Hodarchaeota archaeon]
MGIYNCAFYNFKTSKEKKKEYLSRLVIYGVGPGGEEPGSAMPKDIPNTRSVKKMIDGINFNSKFLHGLRLFSWSCSLFHNVIILQYYFIENDTGISNLEILMN